MVEREYSKKMSDLNRGFEVRLERLVVRCIPSKKSLGSRDIVRVDGSADERSRSDGWSHW